ncbi:MAG: HAMP domain-containing histidine kinase [Eubacterium sp.]|nr:HAMP domain-containing histidine kinase [Eubacterium sp.]
MKSFYRLAAVVFWATVAIFIGANAALLGISRNTQGRMYQVEAARLAKKIRLGGYESIDLSGCQYVDQVIRCESGAGITEQKEDDMLHEFLEGQGSDYLIRSIDGVLYRFDYHINTQTDRGRIVVYANLALFAVALLPVFLLFYIWRNILKPFEMLKDIPYELSKGRLATPLPQQKSRFFSRFIWGVDLLREYMEQQNKRELEMQRAQKTLVLSVSHDLKTPLSAIKLYAKVISRRLYADTAQLEGIAESIDVKADEIGEFVSQMAKASEADFSYIEVINGQFYLSELIRKIAVYYEEKLRLLHTQFQAGAFSDCLLRGDFDRSVEVLQNLMENAVKYGDGSKITLSCSEEEDCVLVTVTNSGNTLPQAEIVHVFESFWRGSNATGSTGSGLGLFICRLLMRRMGGDIFAKAEGEDMSVTVVFPM